MQTIPLEPRPTFISPKKPKNPILDLVPVDPEILNKALASQGFESILSQTKNIPAAELTSALAEDLKDAYEDLSDYPKTIEELQQHFLIAQEQPEETFSPKDPLTANTLDYFNQRLTTINSLIDIIPEKPILTHLLKKEQQRLARLIISLEKMLPNSQDLAA